MTAAGMGTGATGTGTFNPASFTRPTILDTSLLQGQLANGRRHDTLIPFTRTQNNYVGPWISGGPSQLACGNPLIQRNANCMFKGANPLRQFGDYIEQFYLVGQNAARDIYKEVGGIEGFKKIQAGTTTTVVSADLVKSILDTSGGFTKAKAQTTINTSLSGLTQPEDKNKVLSSTLDSLLRIVDTEGSILTANVGTMGYKIQDLKNASTWDSLSEAEKVTCLTEIAEKINAAISGATRGPTPFPTGTATSNPTDIIKTGVFSGIKISDMIDGVATGNIAGFPIGTLDPALAPIATSFSAGPLRSVPFKKSIEDIANAMKTGTFTGINVSNPAGGTVPITNIASFKSFVSGLPPTTGLPPEQVKLIQSYKLLIGIYDGALAGSAPATTGSRTSAVTTPATVQKQTPLPPNIQGLKDRADAELTNINNNAPDKLKNAIANSEACKTLTDNMFCLAQEISGLNVWDPGAAAAAERAFSMAEALATTGIQSALAQLFGTNSQAILAKQQEIEAAKNSEGVEGRTTITEDPMALLLHQTVGVIKTISEHVYKPAKDRIKTSLDTFKTNMGTANQIGKDAMKVQGGGQA